MLSFYHCNIMLLRNIHYLFQFSLVFSIQWSFPNNISCVSYFQVLDFIRGYVGSATPLIAGNSVYMDLLFLKVSKINNWLCSCWIWNGVIWFYLSHYSLGVCISLDFYSVFGKPMLIVLDFWWYLASVASTQHSVSGDIWTYIWQA